MKKVVLLGDSIRLIGYGTKVPELLGPDYEVWQPKDNCMFAKYTLRMLYWHADELKNADIIHWNNGLWEVCELFGDGCTFSNVEEYVENMVRIATLLKRHTDKIIFATTTPVKPNSHTKIETVERFNAALVPKLQALGIEINDLHATVKENLDAYICDDCVHLSEAGIDACARQVTEAIKKLG